MTTKLKFLWMAQFETPNFTFEAFGTTRDNAWKALKEGWDKHAREFDAEPDYLEKYAEDVNYKVVSSGGCFRDGEEL